MEEVVVVVYVVVEDYQQQQQQQHVRPLHHLVEHLVLVRMPWKRLRRARGLVHYPLAGQRKSRDVSRDSRAGPRIVVITSRPDTIDNDHWYSNS